MVKQDAFRVLATIAFVIIASIASRTLGVAELKFEQHLFSRNHNASQGTKVISSFDELTNHIDIYNMIGEPNWGSMPGYVELLSGYDEYFFQDSFLVILSWREGSGGFMPNIETVRADGEIVVKRTRWATTFATVEVSTQLVLEVQRPSNGVIFDEVTITVIDVVDLELFAP